MSKAPAAARLTMSNLIQAGLTVLIAIALAVAAFTSGKAAGKWQEAVSAQSKWSAAVLEDLRHVYGDEAPLAFEVVLSKARARELEGGDAQAEREALFALGQTKGLSAILASRYQLPSGGYAVAERLADVRAQHPRLVALDPDADFAAGDRLYRVAVVLLLLTVPLVLGFVVADLVLRRRPSDQDSAPETAGDVGMVPRPWAKPETRVWTSVALGVWLAVALLPAVQIFFSGQSRRDGATAARTSSEITTRLHAGGLVDGFRLGTKQRLGLMATVATGRQIAASKSADAAEARRLNADAASEERVVARALAAHSEMTRRLSPGAGLDRATVAVANSEASDARTNALLAEQNAAADDAADAGTRASRVAIAILLAALATSLKSLASFHDHRHRGLNFATAGVLGLSLVALLSVALV